MNAKDEIERLVKTAFILGQNARNEPLESFEALKEQCDWVVSFMRLHMDDTDERPERQSIMNDLDREGRTLLFVIALLLCLLLCIYLIY